VRFLFVIDPLETLNLETETSLLMMEEGARRGHESLVAKVDDLYLLDGLARARARTISLDLSRKPFFELGRPEELRLDDVDVALMRKDPPVDGGYLAATFILERTSTPVVNEPASLRLFNEKLLPLAFPGLAPATLMTNDPARVASFVREHRRAILKPLDQCSGRGIRILSAAAPEPGDLAGAFVVVQKFLDEVAAGDKRIYLLEGKVLGAVNRVPRRPEDLANIHQGARVEATVITPRERAIVETIGPELVRRGLWMAGIDVIGGYLTEINVTSPSAVRQINAVSGTALERDLVDFLERTARRQATAR